MKILWASPNTLLDTSNGAAMMIRECLKQLKTRGCEIHILGGTTFVSRQGIALIGEHWPTISAKTGQFVTLSHEDLDHRLLVTHRTERRLMLSFEENLWFGEYCRLLETLKPDIVLFFDNSLITLLTAYEARSRGIPVGVFLMHGNNRGDRWCKDVDFMLTDTEATAKMYKDRENYDMLPIGTFINPDAYRVEENTRQNVLFVNPTPQKGVYFVIQLALMLEETRPDIHFEVIDSRSTWNKMLREVTQILGAPRDTLRNVTVSANTPNMKKVYSRTKILLVPSLWWDSGPRVIVEAMLNGIPVIGSKSGGIPEITGSGGHILDFPDNYKAENQRQIFSAQQIQPARTLIEKMYDYPDYYEKCVQGAYLSHQELHDIDKHADDLLALLQSIRSEKQKARSGL